MAEALYAAQRSAAALLAAAYEDMSQEALYQASAFIHGDDRAQSKRQALEEFAEYLYRRAREVKTSTLTGRQPEAQPRVFRDGDPEPDQALLMGRDGRFVVWYRGQEREDWKWWQHLRDFGPLMEVRNLPNYEVAVAADKRARARNPWLDDEQESRS